MKEKFLDLDEPDTLPHRRTGKPKICKATKGKHDYIFIKELTYLWGRGKYGVYCCSCGKTKYKETK